MAPYKQPRMNSNIPTQDLLRAQTMEAAVASRVQNAIEEEFKELKASALKAREIRDNLLAAEAKLDAYYRKKEKELNELGNSFEFLFMRVKRIVALRVQYEDLSEESPLYPQVQQLCDDFAKIKAKWDMITLSQEYNS